MSHSSPSPLSGGVIDPLELLAFHRAHFGDARMTAGGPGDGGAGAGGTGGGTGGGAGDGGQGGGTKTYDEAHVQRVAAQQRAEGERAALTKLAEQLGMTPEEAKKKLDAATEAERAAMGEADRKTAEAADAKAAADRATATAAQETLNAKVTQQLLVAGVDLGDEKTKDEERAEKLAMAARLVTVQPGADDAAIKAAVDRAKAMVPQLFAPATTTTTGGGDGGAGPTGRQQGAGAFGKEGMSEYERRHGKQTAGASAGT